MVLYIEACESGSMFEGILRQDINVYVTTAANPSESSYACYFDSYRAAYLGDCYSVYWMEDSDKSDFSKRTLKAQFEAVKALTTTSHVQQYGDLSIADMKLEEFQGHEAADAVVISAGETDHVPARSVKVEVLSRRLAAMDSKDPKYKELMQEYNETLARIQKTSETVLKIAEQAVNYDYDLMKVLYMSAYHGLPIGCYDSAARFFSKHCHPFGQDDFAEAYTYIIINMCHMGISAVRQIEVMKEVCSKL